MMAFTIQNLSGRIGVSNKMGYQYKYLNIRKGENSYIISSEVYKFHIEFSYDNDGDLQLHSYFGPGISLDMLDELEQLVMEEFEEDFEDCEEEEENEKCYGELVV